MTTIKDVRTVGVTVHDQTDALDFYERLGFEIRVDGFAGPTMRWVEVAPPGAAVTLALVAGDPGEGATDTGVRFSVADAAEEHAALRHVGVTVGEVLRWHGVPPMFTFDDPDGNRFTIVETAA